MTGDELASALYREQGYLVFCADGPRVIGTIDTENADIPTGRTFMKTPVRYVAEATREEYERQRVISTRLCPDGKPNRTWATHFYRVEAAD